MVINWDPIQANGGIHSYPILWVGWRHSSSCGATQGLAGDIILLGAGQYIPHPGNYSQIPTLPLHPLIISTWWYCLCQEETGYLAPNSLPQHSNSSALKPTHTVFFPSLWMRCPFQSIKDPSSCPSLSPPTPPKSSSGPSFHQPSSISPPTTSLPSLPLSQPFPTELTQAQVSPTLKVYRSPQASPSLGLHFPSQPSISKIHLHSLDSPSLPPVLNSSSSHFS